MWEVFLQLVSLGSYQISIFFPFSSKSKVSFGLNKVLLFVNIGQGLVNLCYVKLI